MKVNRSTSLQWTIPALKLFNPFATVLLIKRFWNIIWSLLSKIFIGKTKSDVDIQLIDTTSHKHIKIDWLYLKCFYQIRILILLHIWLVTKPRRHSDKKLDIASIWLVTKPQRHACLKLEIINYFWKMWDASFLDKI